jgi:hypothetical protein
MHSITLQKMSGGDQYSCLTFDEMPIPKNLRFNQDLDCTEGFEDCGSQGKQIML